MILIDDAGFLHLHLRSSNRKQGCDEHTDRAVLAETDRDHERSWRTFFVREIPNSCEYMNRKTGRKKLEFDINQDNVQKI